MNSGFAKFAFTLVMPLFAGCSQLLPEKKLLETNITPPDHWHAAQTESLPLPAWTQEMVPVPVQQMVHEALLNNPSLAVTAARLDSLRAGYREAHGDLWPQLNFSLNQSDQERLSATGDVVDNRQASTSLSVKWEVDLWGRLNDASQASFATAVASEFDHQAARQSLVARTLMAWAKIIESHRLLNLADDNLANQQHRLRLSEQRLDMGLADSLDVRIAMTTLSRLRDDVIARRAQKQTTLRRFEILLGRYPASSEVDHLNLPRVSPLGPIATPAELLLNRPDLRAAEQRLVASGWRVSAAAKKQLPAINLQLNVARKADSISELFDINQWLTTVTESLVVPVFQGGKLRAGEEKAKAQQTLALAQYKNAILEAWQEVETTLANEHFLQHREQTLKIALEQARSAEQLTEQQYTRGLSSSFNLLSAQRTRIATETEQIRIAVARFNNRIKLQLALGATDPLLSPGATTPDTHQTRKKSGIPHTDNTQQVVTNKELYL